MIVISFLMVRVIIIDKIIWPAKHLGLRPRTEALPLFLEITDLTSEPSGLSVANLFVLDLFYGHSFMPYFF
jgi:hypothetical protein